MQEEKNKLYVGNLPYSIDDEGLKSLFANIEGVVVVEARVILDKFNDNRSKGFGFVTVETEEMAQTAITALNGQEIDGRQIFVNVARPQEKRDNNSAGGGRRDFGRSYR